ncbi:hypothetical protein GCG54_00005561 [Colletotrichum gloeosporioides]|uniref:Uncharacterized protein n=1 Tax=Colletotrichum gloeosporioides TaxID=474922 RepID=A0A8H4CCA3_COLGL|nr:uncharacterized protein GCG54_00005561 [Colletotrichum gloeosporioides]KAF3801405.1 hypothetical protein GCG54_00005561 [Colletotrichum gloeosporioides]
MPNNQNTESLDTISEQSGLISVTNEADLRYLGPSSGLVFTKFVLAGLGKRILSVSDRTSATDFAHNSIIVPSDFSYPIGKTCLPMRGTKGGSCRPIWNTSIYSSRSSTSLPIVFMVLAIGAAHLSRRTKVALSAEGYCSSAMKLVDEILKTSSIASVQCILLLEMYLCNQQPVIRTESLVAPPPWTSIGNGTGAMSQCTGEYIFHLPLDVGDEQLKSDQLKPRQESESPTKVTSAIHLFRLAGFNSEIKCVLYCGDRQYPPYTQPMVVDAENWRVHTLSRLRQWKHNMPRHPEGSPGPRIQNLDKASLRECFQSALTCTELYHSLYVANSLQYGWLSIHYLFLCVMVVFYCVWKPGEIVKEQDFDSVVRALKVSSDILSAIGEYWPEAKRSRDILDRISTATTRRFTQHRNKRGSFQTPQESRTSVEAASNLSSEPVVDWSDMGLPWNGTSSVQFGDEEMIYTAFTIDYGANDESFMSADIMSYFMGSSADVTMGPTDLVHVIDEVQSCFVGGGVNFDHSGEDARQTYLE